MGPIKVLAFCFSLFGCIQAVNAASFDCAKAGTKVEKMICDNSELSKLDDELAKKYAKALEETHKPFAMKMHQLGWLSTRNRCADQECLSKEYSQRIKYFDSLISPKAKCVAPSVDWNNYQWLLVKGKGIPVCEDMINYLKSLPKNSPPPICTEDRIPKNKNWSRPKTKLLNAEERKALVDGVPQEYRQKPKAYWDPSLEWRFTDAAKLRVIYTDISGDGKTDYFLGLTDREDACFKTTHCAMENTKQFDDPDYWTNFVYIDPQLDDYYDLFPMTDNGKQVDWSHPLLSNGGRPPRREGELVYFKGMPYWLTSPYPGWFQAEQDKPLSRSTIDINKEQNGLFRLMSIKPYPKGGRLNPAPFNQIEQLSSFDGEWCSFGYFNRKLIEKFSGNGEK